MSPNVAVVIVNWNKKDDVINLLEELKHVKEPAFDIFVVDNASTDNSVMEIKRNFPNVSIIENKKNLGGTGGFNSGLRSITHQKKYEYIWLLDNDAKIKDDTLTELKKVMDNDSKIGIAGSTIVDIDDKSMIVETGSNFRWDMMGVVPKNRNIKVTDPIEKIIDVDYVAICSALVRTDALPKTGLMDERLFLFWDDMDWGLHFKKQGYKIVAVTTSIAYHGSFTERERGHITNFYYGIRNPLLVYSKHTGFFKRLSIFYRSIRYHLRIYYFLKTCERPFSKLIRYSFRDFVKGIWGKYQYENFISDHSSKNILKNCENINSPKILVSSIVTDSITFKKMIRTIKKTYPTSEIFILINDDRSNYYDKYQTISLNRRNTGYLLHNLLQFIKIYKRRFDIFASSSPLPFRFAANFELEFTYEGKLIGLNKTGIKNFHKLISSIVYSEFHSLYLLPIVMYKSQQYHKHKK